MEKVTNISESKEIPIDIDLLNEEFGFVLGVIQMVHDLEDIQHLDAPWVLMAAEKKIKNIKKLVFEPFGIAVT
jgi:hypothetical protein